MFTETTKAMNSEYTEIIQEFHNRFFVYSIFTDGKKFYLNIAEAQKKELEFEFVQEYQKMPDLKTIKRDIDEKLSQQMQQEAQKEENKMTAVQTKKESAEEAKEKKAELRQFGRILSKLDMVDVMDLAHHVSLQSATMCTILLDMEGAIELSDEDKKVVYNGESKQDLVGYALILLEIFPFSDKAKIKTYQFIEDLVNSI